MTFKETTVSALGGCVFCSKSDAEKRFLEIGVKGGSTELCYVRCNDDEKNYILWVNADNGNLSCLPLFVEDADLGNLNNVTVIPLLRTALIYHKRNQNNGVFYILIKGQNDTVRKIKIFSDEDMIDNYCAVQGYKPYGVALCKVFSIKDNRYITTCWSICYDDPHEHGANGKPQNYETLLTVDLADADLLEEVGVANLYTVLLKEGDTFKTQGKLYRILKDENGKLFITGDLFTRYMEKTREQQLSDNDKRKSVCRIVSLQKNN